jgi:ribonuclease Z
VQTVAGTTVHPAQVLGPSRRGRKLVISGDTRPCPALVAAAKDADLLVHEATFSDDEQQRALETKHSTGREAGRVALEAGVRRLVLTHVSSRYDVDPSRLLSEAREEYKGPAEVAYDGFSVELPLRE